MVESRSYKKVENNISIILHFNFCFYVAIKLGLPMPPPHFGVSSLERSQIVSGINYASASSGILNSTGIVRLKRISKIL